MKDLFQRIAQWPHDWDAAPATLLLTRLREQTALRPCLGLAECKAIVAALEQGIGMTDRAALEQLLIQLLVKKTDDHKAVASAVAAFFDTRARQVFRQAEEMLRAPEPELSPEDLAAHDEAERLSQAKAEEDRLKREREEEERKKQPAPTAAAAPQQTAETSVQLELTLSTAEIAALPEQDEAASSHIAHASAISHPYILTDDYQPISVRQMEQIWRFLRKPSRSNMVNPVPDIPQTVERLARQGWLDTPVWQRDKTNKVHLVLLIDHTGSMTAWHSLIRQLVATARAGGGHRHAEVRWMHNLPHHFEPDVKPGLLFKDHSHLQAEPLADLLRRCSKQDTEVLIVSDAGAARGRMNLGRATATAAFVNLLQRNVSSVAWLNPMPPNRWWGSTAELTAHRVQMFETSPRGFMSMINHLRGQS